MEFISTKEASEKWGISERRIQKLCEEGRIPGVFRFGRSWAIPKDAEKPVDARFKKQ
jgi:DNA binding domain, excisionase family